MLVGRGRGGTVVNLVRAIWANRMNLCNDVFQKRLLDVLDRCPVAPLALKMTLPLFTTRGRSREQRLPGMIRTPATNLRIRDPNLTEGIRSSVFYLDDAHVRGLKEP